MGTRTEKTDRPARRPPATATPVERYTPQRKAEFLLNNAADGKDYARAVKLVREMGLDPEKIAHYKPTGEYYEPAEG